MVVVWDLACPGDALEWLADHPDLDKRRSSGRRAQKVNHPLLEGANEPRRNGHRLDASSVL
jgi:hypothetical protein